MNQKRKEEITKTSLEIVNKIGQDIIDKNAKSIDGVQYYSNYSFGDSGLAQTGVYVISIKNNTKEQNLKDQTDTKTTEGQEEKAIDQLSLYTYEIYDENQNLIATVGEDGKINFSQEYLLSLQELSPEYYAMLDLDIVDFELQELGEDDLEITKEELEEIKDKDKKIDFDKEEKETEDVLEIKDNQLRTLAIIDPHKLLTGNETLGQVIPEANQYDTLEIACEYGDNQNDGKFTMIGVKSDGTKEIVQSMEQVEGINTGRKVTAINRDGTEVEEKEVKGLFQINGRKEDGLSISIGQYNIPEIQYVQNMNDRENRQTIPVGVKSRYDEYVYNRVREEGNRTDGVEASDKEIEQRADQVRENEGEIDPQTIDGTDMELQDVKGEIKEQALENYENMSPKELQEFIRNSLDKYNLHLSEDEIEKSCNEIKMKVEDEARIPSRDNRME